VLHHARSRRPESLWTRGVVACASVLLLATGCSSGPPDIARPALPDRQDAACRALVADLPETLAGERSTEVAGATAYGAAWGDPAIVLTCGVGPMDLSGQPSCVEADGVGWLVPRDQATGDRDATFTADGYRPRVRLQVPKEYLPEQGASALAELAGPVERHLTAAVPCV
jgi:Protein of unknown function (DUF3515)